MIFLSYFFFQQPIFHANGTFLFQSHVPLITPAPSKRADWGWPGVVLAGSSSKVGAASSFPKTAPSKPQDFTQLGPDGKVWWVQPAPIATEPVPPTAAPVSRRMRLAGG